MATGHVYVIDAVGGAVKIGIARDPHRRRAALQTAAPMPLRLAHVETVEEETASHIERRAPRSISAHRLQGEWFATTAAIARDAIRQAREATEGQLECISPPPLAERLEPGEIMSPGVCRLLRQRLGLPLSDLASMAHIYPRTLKGFENGTRTTHNNFKRALRAAFEAAGVRFSSEECICLPAEEPTGEGNPIEWVSKTRTPEAVLTPAEEGRRHGGQRTRTRRRAGGKATP